jgi:DNA modification methylase
MSLGGVKARSNLMDYVCATEDEKRRLKSADRVIEGDIPVDRAFCGRILEIYSLDRSNYTHGFHKFPAKYIPEIPRWGILKFSKQGGCILDPFCGSGTTNVEARLHSRDSYAIDVDPLALLLTKVKTTPLDEKSLYQARNQLIAAIFSETEADIPEFPNRDYWFRPEVLKDLAIITRCIQFVDNRDIRDFFLVCLSSIIKEVSNADPKFLYALAISRKMREQNNHNRKIDVKKTLMERINELMPKMLQFSRACSKESFVRMIGRDAREVDLPNEFIDLAVTSPPYCNAVDYPRAHQLQIYWFNLWAGKLTELKRLYIGTEQVPNELYSKQQLYGNPKLDKVLEEIYRYDKKRSYIVYKYFIDMKKNFLEMKRVLKPRGHYVVAVADNIVRKVAVPTHAFLMDIAQEAGFKVSDHFGSQLMMRPHNMRQSEKMAVEWVMTFQKEG